MTVAKDTTPTAHLATSDWTFSVVFQQKQQIPTGTLSLGLMSLALRGLTGKKWDLF